MNQLKKGMKKLFEQQHHLSNKVVKLEDDMKFLTHVAIEGLKHLQSESAIYIYQNSKFIQQKCTIEYHPKLNPELKVLNAGKYLLLGNSPLL